MAADYVVMEGPRASAAMILSWFSQNILAWTPHDDVIKWKHFLSYWPFVGGIHRSPVNSLHKGLWRGAFMFSLICAWINHWVNNREAGDLRGYRAHYDVIVMIRAKHPLVTKWKDSVKSQSNTWHLYGTLILPWCIGNWLKVLSCLYGCTEWQKT